MDQNVFITEELSSVVDNITGKFNIEQMYLNTYKQEQTPYELII
ncbi:hypothetical protein OKW96_14885 [Sphingobacterium sp. KU25419]|nr:hypothetical protein OKW96_14885 [Sphingobacterium sp. KU25419]